MCIAIGLTLRFAADSRRPSCAFGQVPRIVGARATRLGTSLWSGTSGLVATFCPVDVKPPAGGALRGGCRHTSNPLTAGIPI